MNVDVPGRLSLVGYDNSYLARLRSIWLTSVDSAGFDAGRLAARTLLARVADPARPAELHLLTPGPPGPRLHRAPGLAAGQRPRWRQCAGSVDQPRQLLTAATPGAARA